MSPNDLRHQLWRLAKKAAPVVKRAIEQAAQKTDPDELAQLHPLDVIERMLSELPAATLKAIKEETRQEHRRPIPEAVKKAVRARDKRKCVVCGAKTSLHLHHYKHVAHGGANTTDNLVTLCANHHMAVHADLVKVSRPKKVLGVDARQ